MISTIPVPLNILSSIRDNLDPASNVTEESDLNFEKHLLSKTSIDGGRKISTKPVPNNSNSSIYDNLDPDSRVTQKVICTHQIRSHPRFQQMEQ
jgi:hypothetical protein